MNTSHDTNLLDDLVLPTALFVALGAMTWAVRGCAGYGATMGCIFAGVTWGTAWWFMAYTPSGVQRRRYSSGWIIPALTFGIGISGGRGWMQWASFFEGRLQTDAAAGAFVPISPAYGFLWLFIAGVPWAGLGACLLAWCAPERPLRPMDWAVRMACGIGGGVLAAVLFHRFPSLFLPLYDQIADRYHDLAANPNLKRLMGDNGLAMIHLGVYLGFLLYEGIRRDWKNVVLISTVGVVNGVGWALCQNWKWAPGLWPGVEFNWWRCWESSGGISIGLAYGIAYYLVNRPMPAKRTAAAPSSALHNHPNLERFGLAFGLLFGLAVSIRNGLKGSASIYFGNEEYWSRLLSLIFIPLLLGLLLLCIDYIRRNPLPAAGPGVLFPYAAWIMWAVLLIQHLMGQLVTGPRTSWTENYFAAYYGVLFVIAAGIIGYVQRGKRLESAAIETQ